MWLLDASVWGVVRLFQSPDDTVWWASDVWTTASTRLPPSSGVSPHSNNSFRSAWPERANLSTCYSSQSVSRRLCCTMRNRRRALRSSHSPLDSNLAVFFNRITRQKHLTHLSRVISLPNHDVCLEYSQTLYEFG